MIENFSKEKCLDIYKYLKLGRRFEEKTIELGNNGEIPGSLHAGIGMEAIGVGISLALKEGDLTFKTHRGHPYMIAEGADIRYMFSELMGKGNGHNKGRGGSMHLAGISGVLGSTTHMAQELHWLLSLERKIELLLHIMVMARQIKVLFMKL